MHVLFVLDLMEKSFHPAISALSGCLKFKGHTTSLLSIPREKSLEEFREMIRNEEKEPQLVAFTVMSFQWVRVKELTQAVREVLSVPILCGGYHPTIFPEEVIAHPAVDILCRGEGEFPIMDLANALERGSDIRRIPNLWVKQGMGGALEGKPAIFRNEPRPIISDMNRLPFWDREIYKVEEYENEYGQISFFRARRTMPIIAGRGCPYHCAFCCNSFMQKFYKNCGRFVRHRGIPHLLSEMRAIASRYFVDFFEFWDENFEADPYWLMEFCEAYAAEVNFPFVIGLRPEKATPSLLTLLKRANCWVICMGVETGEEKYRREMLNKKATNEQIIRAFQEARDLGIVTVSFNMVGMPDETPEMVEGTLEFNRRLNPHYISFSAFKPLPGTRLFEYCREKGYLFGESYNTTFNTPMLSLQQASMTQEEFQRLWKVCDDFCKEMGDRNK